MTKAELQFQLDWERTRLYFAVEIANAMEKAADHAERYLEFVQRQSAELEHQTALLQDVNIELEEKVRLEKLCREQGAQGAEKNR